MDEGAQTERTLRAMIEEIDTRLLELIEARRGLDHDHLQRIAVLETARSAAWRLLHRNARAARS